MKLSCELKISDETQNERNTCKHYKIGCQIKIHADIFSKAVSPYFLSLFLNRSVG